MSSIPLVDAHCHFDFPRFDGIRQAEWAKAKASGVRGLVIPGVRRTDWQRVQSTADPDSGIWYCLGIHPWFVDEHGPSDLQALEHALVSVPAGCLAIGECGLDALTGDLAAQETWFRRQIDIARHHRLPLVIHSVKAHDQVYSILKAKRWEGRALVHGFSGSFQQAKKLVELGCFIGVGGVITYDRAQKTRGAIARLPVDALVLETDAPDMAPAGVAKGMNSPVVLPGILAALAELRKENPDQLARALLANTARLYGVAPGVLAPEL